MWTTGNLSVLNTSNVGTWLTKMTMLSNGWISLIWLAVVYVVAFTSLTAQGTNTPKESSAASLFITSLLAMILWMGELLSFGFLSIVWAALILNAIWLWIGGDRGA